MADRPDPIVKAANSASPGVPRQIRARTGQTTDPVPEGFEQESPKRYFPLEPAQRDEERAKPKSPLALGVSEDQLAIKSDVKGDDLAKELAHSNATLEMKQRDAQRQQEERIKVRGAEMPPTNRATWMGTSTAANKILDSRSGPRPS